MTCEEAKELVKPRLSHKRWTHTKNVKKMAVQLAERWGENPEKAALAALLHDSAKELPRDALLQIFADNAIIAENAPARPAAIWHGIAAAILAETQWGVTDPEILSAIRCHTTGKPGMSLLDKILYLADMTSAERDWPGVEELRRLEMEDLDKALLAALKQSIDFVDAFGHKQLSGTANYLASYIAGEIGCKTRAIELSSLQRSASHCASRVDILEAYQVGGAAVKAADEGDSGKMVVLQRLSDDPYQSGTEVKDVHKIANDEKLVPREWVTEDGSYVTDEFVSYVRPLIQGDVSPVMVDGIPRHLYRQL